MHLLPHLGISRVAHLPYIERSEKERRGREKEREIAPERRREREGRRDEGMEKEIERNLGAR